MNQRGIIIGILTIALTFSFGSIVSADDDEPRLEINVDRVNPGGVVDVRGVDFGREEVITLMLVNGQTAIPLGEIIADVEGVFLQTVLLPVELAEGTYNFLAITDDHNTTSPDLTVQGPAITSEGEGEDGRRDEEDTLLAPVPTYPPGVIPGVAPGPTQAVIVESEYSGVNFPVVVLGGIVFMLGVVLFVIQRQKHR